MNGEFNIFMGGYSHDTTKQVMCQGIARNIIKKCHGE
jgi:hypothetical protein